MTTEQKRNFVAMVSGTEGQENAYYLNMDQIRMIDNIRAGHCRIWLSETHQIEINGPGVAKFIARVADRSIELSGEELHISEDNIASLKSQ